MVFKDFEVHRPLNMDIVNKGIGNGSNNTTQPQKDMVSRMTPYKYIIYIYTILYIYIYVCVPFHTGNDGLHIEIYIICMYMCLFIPLA